MAREGAKTFRHPYIKKEIARIHMVNLEEYGKNISTELVFNMSEIG
jgi:hypothetical protein